MKKIRGKALRNGYTTGSAASAAAVAAYRQSAAPVRLHLPGGGQLTVPILRLLPDGAVVIKDGGDDPDVTTGCEVVVRLRRNPGPPGPADYQEVAGDLQLTVRGGPGVGMVTRPGLAVPVGRSAINPAPRRMLAENLAAVGCRGEWLVEISVPDGAEIAEKTLNPRLGIVGGISILGRSGIVRPYSHAAYAATVALQLRSCGVNRMPVAALVTGNRTAAAVLRDFPELTPDAVVRIGDFIAVGVRAARTAGLPRLLVGCMAGKLFKYACGETNTHAHRCRMNLGRLREFGLETPGVSPESLETMGELAARIPESCYRRILAELLPRATAVLQEWAGPETRVEVVLYGDDGKRWG